MKTEHGAQERRRELNRLAAQKLRNRQKERALTIRQVFVVLLLLFVIFLENVVCSQTHAQMRICDPVSIQMKNSYC